MIEAEKGSLLRAARRSGEHNPAEFVLGGQYTVSIETK